MTAVLVEWFKWPATPYRVTPMNRLGRDEEGTWLFAPKGTAGTYAAVGEVALQAHFLTLVPARKRWWMCTWMWGNPASDIELYVDIVYPAAWTSDVCLRVIDLDLDVIRLRDGRVVLDDEDEFAKHSVSLGYPPAVVAAARAAAGELLNAVIERAQPHSAPPAHWLEAAAQASTPTS
jgi:uncharacterized protein